MEPAIEAVGLSKSFKRNREQRTSLKERLVRGQAPEPPVFWALKDATFSVPKGASMGLIGHNGSGKSTALKVLTGIYRPTSGTVNVNGSVSALLEVGAGFHPDLTGRENIKLNATILGFTSREISGLMGQIIEFADIGDFIDSPIKHYSSGMYLRLGFAVAVMVRPEILIVDEVIAVGDEEFQRKCFDHLHALRKAGTSMVVVSHGLGNINDLCDEAIWLEGGVVRQMGPSRSVTRAYLDEVNAREATRFSGVVDAGQGLGAARARRGTGQIRVTSVDVLDAQGDPAVLVKTGEAARFRIRFVAGEPVDGVVFSISMGNPEGLEMLGVNSWRTGPMTIGTGQNHVDFVAEPLLLSAGSYELKPTLTVESSIIDALDDGFDVVVRNPDVQPAGPYFQPGHWELGR